MAIKLLTSRGVPAWSFRSRRLLKMSAYVVWDYILRRLLTICIQSSFDLFTFPDFGNRYVLRRSRVGSGINIDPSLVSPLDPVEAAKRLAAYTAVDNHIRPEDKVGHHTWMCELAQSNHYRSLALAPVRTIHYTPLSHLTGTCRFHSAIRCGAHPATGRGTKQRSRVSPYRISVATAHHTCRPAPR
jgi:hypothetical protein